MTDERRLPILEHLNELRWRLFKMSVAIVLGAIVAFIFKDQLIDVLSQPYHSAFPEGRPLASFTVTEQFSVAMKVAFFGGIFLASPVIFYQIWAFVNPALSTRERRWAVPIVASLVVLFGVGVVFGYWTLPRGLDFLLQVLPEVDAVLRIGDYMSFVMRFLLVFGVAFEFPLFLFVAAAAGLVSSAQLKRGRRWAVLLIVVIGAAVTPTGDPLTLMALSLPLYVFYEATIWLVKLVLRR